MAIQTIERLAPATCASCQHFNPNQGVYGWCGVFDRMAKPLHQRTSICDKEIEVLEKQAQLKAEPHFTGVEAEVDSRKQLHPQWSITWDDKWNWYRAWVGKSYAGCASSYQEAESLAQKYSAAQEFNQKHRQKVMAAYSC